MTTSTKAWTYQDHVIGNCKKEDIGYPKPAFLTEELDHMGNPASNPTSDPAPDTSPHPLTIGIDLTHPDADRAILRRVYHADPQAFLSAYGTAGINKLMDLAVKEGASLAHPDLYDTKAWNKIAADVAKLTTAQPTYGGIAFPAMVLALAHDSGGNFAALKHALNAATDSQP